MQIPPREARGEAGRWMVVLLGFLTLAFAFTVRGSLSLAMPAWQVEFGWSRSAVSGVAATALLVMAVVAPFAGHLVDRRGARALLAAGLCAIGVGVAMVVLARPGEGTWLLPFGFAGVAAVGFGIIAQHVIAAAIAQRFEQHRGLATGVGTSGSTAGQLLLMPVVAWLMQAGQWRSAFLLLAGGCLVLIPCAWFLLRGSASPPASPSRREAGPNDPQATSLTANLELVLKNPTFHAIFWSYAICGFTTSGVIETHLMPYAEICGFGPVPSATAYGVMSGVNLIGMIGAGWLSDRVHRPRLLAVIYVMRALSFMVLMVVTTSYPRLIVFAVFFGLFDYSTVPVTASYIASRLGVKVAGLSMGLLSAGHAIGGAAGAWAGGAVFDRSGGYQALWGISTGPLLAAAALVSRLKDDGQRPSKSFCTSVHTISPAEPPLTPGVRG